MPPRRGKRADADKISAETAVDKEEAPAVDKPAPPPPRMSKRKIQTTRKEDFFYVEGTSSRRGASTSSSSSSSSSPAPKLKVEGASAPKAAPKTAPPPVEAPAVSPRLPRKRKAVGANKKDEDKKNTASRSPSPPPPSPVKKAREAKRAKTKDEKEVQKPPAPPTEKVPEKIPVYLQQSLMNKPVLATAAKSSSSVAASVSSASISTNDVYDLDCYGEEFGPQPKDEGGKKKRKAVKRKKRGDIILTFGRQARENVAPILKELKNLKTPVPAAKKRDENRVPLKAVSQVPAIRVVHTAAVEPRKEESFSMAFSRDCDDFLPSFDAPTSVADFSARTPSSPAAAMSLLHVPRSSSGNSQSQQQQQQNKVSPASTNAPPRYKTPAIPKNVSKREGKVSTPRLDDKLKITEDLSTKDQVKMCFGFDDSEVEDNDSMLDISPVRGGGCESEQTNKNNPFTSPSGSMMASSRLSTISIYREGGAAASETKEGPARFDMPRGSRAVPHFPCNVSKISYGASKLMSPPPSSSSISSNKGIGVTKVRAPPVPVKIVQSEAAQMEEPQAKEEEDAAQESSLFSECKVPEVVPPPKENADLAATDECDDPKEEETVGGKKNAFTLMRKGGGGGQSSPKVPPLKGSKKVSKKGRPQESAKQSLIYEAAGGGKKQLKSKQTNESKKSTIDVTEASTSNVNLHKSKTYCNRTLNTSITASPVKKNKKQEKEINQWANLQSSHFSEVDDYDLSFA